MPTNVEDYIHRIGRTGRAGNKGYAVSFFTEKSSRMAGELCKILRDANQEVPPALEAMSSRVGGGGGGHSRYGGGGGGGRW